jgi:hypothetical protein
MKWKCVSLVLGLACLVLLIVVLGVWTKDKDTYDANDVHEGHKALEMLKNMKASGNEPVEMDERDIDRLGGKIQMAGLKIDDDGKEGYDSMKFPRFPPATLKALYESGVPINRVYTSWPPGLFNRLYYWYPGFYTSGMSWWLRPMQRYGKQAFWVKSNGNYYYIRN